MNEIDIDQERESNDSRVSQGKSNESEGKYEKYCESNGENNEAKRIQSSSEYTPYKGQTVELVYDRYDTDYQVEQPGQEPKPTSCIRKEKCCIKGWFSYLEIEAVISLFPH